MDVIPLIIAALLAAVLLTGYVAVLLGIRREGRAMSLRYGPAGASESLARKVTGCYVRSGLS
ncbi:hypothetical protein AB0L05_35710 [Nonomuraea pusilla]|uniref:hypothetical protein n=1 Tax=Nonomuraea pusilla TaxID=46177 RepID=UPI003317AB93